MGTVDTFPHPECTPSRQLCLVWGSASTKIAVGAPLPVAAEVGKVMTSSWSGVESCLGTGWRFLVAAAPSGEQFDGEIWPCKSRGLHIPLVWLSGDIFPAPLLGEQSCHDFMIHLLPVLSCLGLSAVYLVLPPSVLECVGAVPGVGVPRGRDGQVPAHCWCRCGQRGLAGTARGAWAGAGSLFLL